MDADRIAALLQPFFEGSPLAADTQGREFGLSPIQFDQISTYIDLLLRWNSRINLTAIRNPEEIVTRHFGESLFLARNLFPAGAEWRSGSTTDRRLSPDVIDLGSGAGFPALPLKIWAPDIHLVMIESNHKKVAFLREVARALTLTNVDVIADRAEMVSTQPEPPRAGVVTFRAVEKFDKILPLAATFLSPSGRLALLISSAQVPELGKLGECQTFSIPQSSHRVLAVVRDRSGK